MVPKKRLSSLLLVAALLLACLLNTVSAGLPAGEHIGTPAKEHVKTAGQHIGTPAQKHVNTSGQHISAPASARPVHLSSHSASLSEPRIATPPSADLAPRSRHHVKSRQTQTNGKVTFYYGSQLLNPACPGARTPDDWSMTAAISFDSPFHCGDRVRISDGKGKHAIVTVVDRCAGCSADWMDVTKGVFRVFSGLDRGVLHGVTFHKM